MPRHSPASLRRRARGASETVTITLALPIGACWPIDASIIVLNKDAPSTSLRRATTWAVTSVVGERQCKLSRRVALLVAAYLQELFDGAPEPLGPTNPLHVALNALFVALDLERLS